MNQDRLTRGIGFGVIALTVAFTAGIVIRFGYSAHSESSPPVVLPPEKAPAANRAPSQASDELGSRPVDPRKASLVRSQLNVLRSQVELYKTQHHDNLPDLLRFPNWEQLTRKTRPDGTFTRGADLGPYLQQPPVNALNGLTRAAVVHQPLRPGDSLADQRAGWVVSTRDGRLYATDPTGRRVWDEAAPPEPAARGGR